MTPIREFISEKISTCSNLLLKVTLKSFLKELDQKKTLTLRSTLKFNDEDYSKFFDALGDDTECEKIYFYEFPEEQFKALSLALKKNKTITEVSFGDKPSEAALALINEAMMVNKSITKVGEFETFNNACNEQYLARNECLKIIKSINQEPKPTRLEFNYVPEELFTSFIEELKQNDTISSLRFRKKPSPTEVALLNEAIRVNTAITRIDVFETFDSVFDEDYLARNQCLAMLKRFSPSSSLKDQYSSGEINTFNQFAKNVLPKLQKKDELTNSTKEKIQRLNQKLIELKQIETIKSLLETNDADATVDAYRKLVDMTFNEPIFQKEALALRKAIEENEEENAKLKVYKYLTETNKLSLGIDREPILKNKHAVELLLNFKTVDVILTQDDLAFLISTKPDDLLLSRAASLTLAANLKDPASLENLLNQYKATLEQLLNFGPASGLREEKYWKSMIPFSSCANTPIQNLTGTLLAFSQPTQPLSEGAENLVIELALLSREEQQKQKEIFSRELAKKAMAFSQCVGIKKVIHCRFFEKYTSALYNRLYTALSERVNQPNALASIYQNLVNKLIFNVLENYALTSASHQDTLIILNKIVKLESKCDEESKEKLILLLNAALLLDQQQNKPKKDVKFFQKTKQKKSPTLFSTITRNINDTPLLRTLLTSSPEQTLSEGLARELISQKGPSLTFQELYDINSSSSCRYGR